MNVYKISEDVNTYQWLIPENEGDLFDHLSFECERKMNRWDPLKMYVFNPQKKQGNFYSLGGTGALAFDEKVLDSMLAILEMAGEILPVKVGNTTLYILNVLECINSLDEDKSTWDYYNDGTRGRLLKYEFHRNRITESSVFKIPETCKTEVLTYSGLKDFGDDFFSMYQKNQFTGLTFENIFSR